MPLSLFLLSFLFILVLLFFILLSLITITLLIVTFIVIVIVVVISTNIATTLIAGISTINQRTLMPKCTLFWGPYNKDPTIWGTILGSPIFGNHHISPIGQRRVVKFEDRPRLCQLRGALISERCLLKLDLGFRV